MTYISNSKVDFHNIEDNVLLMRNSESSMYDFFYSMESVVEQLSMDEINCNFDSFCESFNNFIKEFDYFKSHHQIFVENFIVMNTSSESTDENFLSRFTFAICDFEEFNDIDVNIHAIDFTDISCFQSEYKRLKNYYEKFMEYYVRINQYYLQFKEDSNEILRIAQWNCNGLEGNENELLKYINDENLDIILLQDAPQKKSFRIPGYVTMKNNREGPKIGSVMAIFNEKICADLKDISINTKDKITDFQILKLSLKKLQLTIVNMFSPYALNPNFDLYPLLPSLTDNSIILGYFNICSTQWGDHVNKPLGEKIENILHNCDFHLLNDGTPICLSKNGDEIGDLSLCTYSLRPYITWRVDDCNLGSDHRVIRMDIDITKLCEFL